MITKADTYPLSHINVLLVGQVKYFSLMDLASGYWQIWMSKWLQEKTGFVTPQGLFEFCVMLFRLTNALSVFQWLMSRVLMGLDPTDRPDFVTVYNNVGGTSTAPWMCENPGNWPHAQAWQVQIYLSRNGLPLTHDNSWVKDKPVSGQGSRGVFMSYGCVRIMEILGYEFVLLTIHQGLLMYLPIHFMHWPGREMC